MRAVPLLVILLCSVSVSSAPDMSKAAAPMTVAPMTAALGSVADEADYQALQQQADLARDVLAQAQGRRVAALVID